jgi:hypothetical protein
MEGAHDKAILSTDFIELMDSKKCDKRWSMSLVWLITAMLSLSNAVVANFDHYAWLEKENKTIDGKLFVGFDIDRFGD